MRLQEAIFKVVTPLIAILLAFLVGGIIIVSIGKSPLEAYLFLFKGAFGSESALATTLVKATPLIFTGLAATFAYRCGVFNLGAEGQFIMGSIASIVVATMLPKAVALPTPLVFITSMIAGIVFGGLWGALPGLLKVWRGLNELIVTILLNYVATLFMSYLVNGPLMEGDIPQTAAIKDQLKIPLLSNTMRLHYGFFAALLVALIIYYFLFQTSKGLQLRSVGLNQLASKVYGINVNRFVLISFIISGAIAGLGGSIEVHGYAFRLMPGYGSGFGFDGVAIALIGQLNPIGTVIAACFYAALRTGANMMQVVSGIPTSVVAIVQALVIIFVIAGSALTNLPRVKAFFQKVFKEV
ncbi:MAG: ABC transporter permease [Desulfosporosinus sp.]|nr:ABC transporter permease [Desulfosporosinus sp.]